jgi:leader peptidase (prepilin peptidase) / N-methyltransferase
MPIFQEIQETAPWFWPVFAAVIGACVGSFLNVCIYRIPKGESVVSPPSHCACGARIKWHDNIPVLSWLLLGGKARCCGRAFSVRYPAVELLTAVLFTVCAVLFPAGKAVGAMVLCAIVICAVFIDLDHMIIPDVFTIGGAAAGLALAVLLPSLHGQAHDYHLIAGLRSAREAMLGLMVGSGVVLWIALFAEAVLKKEAMGFGDVKFLGAVGAFIGWKGAVFGMFAGAMLGTLWFVAAVLWRKATGRTAPIAPRAETPDGQPAELGLGVHVPFGPMLGVAGLIYLFGANRWVDEYFASLALLF